MGRPKRWTVKADKSKSGIYTIELSSWKYFSDYINQELLDYTDYIYRGHGDTSWLLEPTIDRVIKDPDSKKRNTHLNEFKFESRGRRGSNPPKISDENEWWALGQHHGLLTPLLDWTASPFVALFFAVSKAIEIESESCTVFCLFQNSVHKVNKVIKDDKQIPLINGLKPTIKIFKPLSDENPRLVSQRGLFTRGPNNLDIEEWFKTYKKKSDYMDLMKITMPNKDIQDALSYLNRMNLNPSTLFPDLSGASEYCNLSLEIQNYS